MNTIKRGSSGYITSVCGLFTTATSAATTVQLLYNTSMDQKHREKICASLGIITCLVQNKRKFFRDNIKIFFSEEDKKGIITFDGASIEKVCIAIGNSPARNAPYTMTATLNKPTIRIQGETNYAERRINLQGYSHSWEHEPSATDCAPQIIISLTGTNRQSSLEANFVHSKAKNSLSLDVKSRKYEEYVPIPAVNSSYNYIKKALGMRIGKLSFLQILLEKYFSEENFQADAAKAFYLVDNFSNLLQKSVLASFDKKYKKLSHSSVETESLQCNTSFRIALGDSAVASDLVTLHGLADDHFESLKADMLELLRARACEYENLHEPLSHKAYKDSICPGMEDVIACYPDKTNKLTNASLRKSISLNKALLLKMKAIHGYIESCRKHHNGQLSYTTDHSIPKSQATYGYAHKVLCNFMEQENLPTNEWSAVIAYARQKVVRKYKGLFLNDIAGITEKISATIHKLNIKVERFKLEEDESFDSWCNTSITAP
ncbi:MAG: hypothetical protein ACTJLK_03075 [Anaplasma sp.]